MLTQIIIGFVILIVFFLLYKAFSGSSDSVLVGMHDAKTEQTISASDLPGSDNTSLWSYSIWFALEDWNYQFDESKILFSRVDSQGNVGPEVKFGAVDNSITVSLATYAGDTQACTINNVPLQKWVNLIVVLNNRALDLYLDGKLVRTCVLDGVAKIAQGSSVYLTPSGGFSGSTSQFRYFDYPVNPRQAYEIYREGYGASSLSFFDKYRIKLAFVKDNQEVGSLEI